MFILDAAGRSIFVNAHGLKVWGKHLHELLDRTFEEAVPDEATQEVKAAFQYALKRSGKLFR